MKVWGVNETQLGLIAQEVGVKLYYLREDGRALRFTLRPTGEKIDGDYRYQRTSASGFHPERRVHAVCWHGHRDFMRAIFAREPEARIKTKWADYRGSEDFEEKFEATGYRSVGAPFHPMQAREVCNCWKGNFPYVEVNNVTRMIQSDMLRCPFVIIDPSHYRTDGTCKCNDPQERERMKREWEYTDEDFRKVGVA